MKEHKYSELAMQINKEFVDLCSKQPCGECKYAFQDNCKTLFTLDYLENKEKKIKTVGRTQMTK